MCKKQKVVTIITFAKIKSVIASIGVKIRRLRAEVGEAASDAQSNAFYENKRLTEADTLTYMKTGITQHTKNKKQRMMEAGKKIILTTLAEIKSFISRAISGRAGGEICAYATVGERLAKAVRDVRDSLEIQGKYIELNADDLRESYKRHSTPKEKGDIPLSEKDFENIPEYIDTFDGVLAVNEYNGKVEVHLYKKGEDGYFRILTVSSKERNSLIVTKLIGVSKEKFENKYAKKIERNTGSPRGQTIIIEASNPSTTARHTASALSIDSITENGENVNSEAKKSKAEQLKSPEEQLKNAKLQGVREAAKLTGEQRRALGELQTLTTSAVFESPMQKSALSAIAGAEAIAEKLNADGNIKMVDGKMQSVTPESIAELQKKGAEVRDITAEDIRAGVDAKNGKSVAKAMQKNDLLRYIVASDVAGRFMMTANEVEAAARAGTKIKSQADLNAFIENASDERKSALGAELGIADSEWATMSLKRFNQAAVAYRESGKLEGQRAKAKVVEEIKKAPLDRAVKSIPTAEAIRSLSDGVTRYRTENVDLGVYKKGKSYVLHDYNTDTTTKEIDVATVESALAGVRNGGGNADISGLTSTEQGNMSVSGGNSLKNSEKSENSVKNSENSLSPSVRFSIDNGKVVVDTDQNIFEGADRKDYGKIARNYMREHFRGKTVEDAEFTKVSEREYTSSRATQSLYKKSDGVYDTKMKASTELDNMLRVAQKVGHEDAKHPHDFNQNGYDRYAVTFSLNGNEFSGELLVAVNENGRRTFYDIVKIKRSDSPVSAGLAERGTNASSSGMDSATNSISQKSDLSTQNSENSSEKSSKEKIAEVKERIDVKKIDAYCRENIEGYASMSAANQSMIRQIVREGRVYGLDDADILSYARVAAHTGLNVTFDVTSEKVRVNSEEVSDIAGYYDPENNRIVVNPKAEKRQELILIHELDHAVRAYLGVDGKIHYLAYKGAEQRLSKETRDFVRGKEYSEQKIDVSREELFADEASAYYTEAILGPKVTIDMLLGKEPSLAKKMLNFFTGAARAYSKDAKLSKEARRHYKNFKKMFDAFAEWNKGRNSATAVASEERRVNSEEVGESVRFSLSATAELEVDDVLKNKFHKDFVKLTDNTPPILLAQKGVKNLPLYMKPSHVRENIFTESEASSKGYKVDGRINYHGLGKEKFLEVIADLDNVVEAYRGTKNADNPQRREKYFLLISRITDADGNVINVPIYINEKADYHNVVVDTNKVATVFGKNQLREYIRREIGKRNIVKIKNRSLQVGDAAAPIAAPYDVNASDTSISQNEDLSTGSAKKVSENSDKISKSARKSGDFEAKLSDAEDSDKVTISKGQAQKLAANYNSDRVYDKKDVLTNKNNYVKI